MNFPDSFRPFELRQQWPHRSTNLVHSILATISWRPIAARRISAVLCFAIYRILCFPLWQLWNAWIFAFAWKISHQIGQTWLPSIQQRLCTLGYSIKSRISLKESTEAWKRQNPWLPELWRFQIARHAQIIHLKCLLQLNKQESRGFWCKCRQLLSNRRSAS